MLHNQTIILFLCSLWTCSVFPDITVQYDQTLQSQLLIHRLDFDAKDPALVLELEEGIAILPYKQLNADLIAKLYQARNKQTEIALEPGHDDALVAVGPLLDSPDQVFVREFSFKKDRIYIEVAHTNVRLEGAGFRRNQPWRPILLFSLPKLLLPGRYQAEVVWQALDLLTFGKPLASPYRTGPVYFLVKSE